MSNDPILQAVWTPEDARLLAAIARRAEGVPVTAKQLPREVGVRPRRLRLLAMLAVVGAALAAFTVGTATEAHADVMRNNTTMTDGVFAVTIVFEAVVVGIIALVVTFAALWLWDYLTGRWN
jgi:heme/copper-type cytochrome/quinol oxidase subunit 1